MFSSSAYSCLANPLSLLTIIPPYDIRITPADNQFDSFCPSVTPYNMVGNAPDESKLARITDYLRDKGFFSGVLLIPNHINRCGAFIFCSFTKRNMPKYIKKCKKKSPLKK